MEVMRLKMERRSEEQETEVICGRLKMERRSEEQETEVICGRLKMEQRSEEQETEVICGWQTPKRAECKIPVPSRCPEPPKKKSPAAEFGKRRGPPKNGYFHPPDLEAIFSLAPRTGACV